MKSKFVNMGPSRTTRLPVYLDDDVAEFVRKCARKKKTDAQTVVNRLLRGNKEWIQAIE